MDEPDGLDLTERLVTPAEMAQIMDRTPTGRGESFDGWPGKRDEYPTPS